MVNGINLKSLRNVEFSQFISDVLAIVNRKDPAVLKVEEAYKQLKTENDLLTELINPKKGSQLTAQIEVADDRRDELVTGINWIVEGHALHFDPDIRTHAETLLQNLRQFGGSSLARDNYQSETAGINSMLADWENKSELSAAITELNLEGWKAQLSEANELFNDLFLNRTEEKSAVEATSVREQRNIMRQLYYRLRDLITSYHLIEKGAEPYDSLIKQLNTLIDKYNRLLMSRKGKAEKEFVELD